MARANRATAILLTVVAVIASACKGDDKPREKGMPDPFAFTPPPGFGDDAGGPTRPSLAASGQLLVDPGGADGTLVSQAVVTLNATKDGKGGGVVRFGATPTGIRLKAELTGLSFLTNYGLYVHVVGDCSAPDAASAGPTFNFDGSSLDPPDVRYGALGELKAEVSGEAKGEGKVPGAALQGPYSIIGRSVVLHATSSDPNNPIFGAGTRLACGVVGVAAEFAAQ
jgi:Cu-Zn family superoxide dismutase